MKIVINDSRKIYAIQKEFSNEFPFLKIQFFAKSNTKTGKSSAKTIKHSSKELAQCRTQHTIGEIEIVPEMSVNSLEQNFQDIFGLHVEVLRKSGKAWLETSVTGNWSLMEQNAEGMALEQNEYEES
ncbi:MAG: hypothetical protein RJA07_1620 [Bacteroidota bacterium]|jgi:hypothetical protein